MISVQLTETGPIAPDFPTLLEELKSEYRKIFGDDVYIEADSQDGQLLGVFASAMNDSNTATINALNSFSPNYASGTGLSSVVKINGIQRLVPTHSTCSVNLSGQAGREVINGQAQDIYGNYWNLPSPLQFPSTGHLSLTAVAAEPGAISVASGEITKIATPTLGWQTIINPSASIPGAPVETDSELRARQSISVSLPALNTYESIQAGIANLTGVQKYKVYENDTGSTNSIGVPAHSIWAVVKGGDEVQICTSIANSKSPGTGTFGSTTHNIDVGGTSTAIHFGIAVTAGILVDVHIHPNSTYNTTVNDRIKQNILDYFKTLEIGQTMEYSHVLAAAVGTEYNTVTVLVSPDWAISWGTSDIACVANDLIESSLANISITIV